MTSHVHTTCIFTYFIDRVVNLVQKERKTAMRGAIMKGKTLYHCCLLQCQPKYVRPDYSCSHSTETWHSKEILSVCALADFLYGWPDMCIVLCLCLPELEGDC